MRRLQYLFLGGVFLLVVSSVRAQVPNLHAVQMVDSDVGFIAGTGGTILKSVNGGLNWYSLPSSTSLNLGDVHFLNTTTGGVVGGDALASASVISRTENGGQNWTNQPSGVSTILTGIVHLDALNAIAVGNAGQIRRTTDAGSTWSGVSSGVSVNLKKISFVTPATGYIVGWSGTVLRTDNGGATWTSLSSGTTTILYDVDFTTTNIGTAVGYSGTILRTTDGGASWSQQTSATVESLYGVDFVDQNNGYIVGSTGLVLKTTDGGASWTRLTPGTYQNLSGVSFLSPTTGIIVGGSETILRTTDGGSTWTQSTIDSTAPTPPPAPLLASPADGAAGIQLPPTLTWNASTGATGYRLQISTNSGFTAVVHDDASLTGLSTTVNGLGYGSTYYWRVNADNSEGTSGWSAVRSFTTESNAQVTVQTVPGGRSFMVDGVSYSNSHTFTFNPGETHSLSADSIQSQSGGGRFLWSAWSDGGGRSHDMTFPGQDTTISVSFARQFFLTMSADTGGTVSPPSAWYDSAAVVEISAAASAGYGFVSWTGTGAGSYSGAADTSTVTMNGPVTEYAEFTLSAVPVTVTTDPPGLAVTVDGVSTTAPGFFNWIPGSSHTVSTNSVQADSGGARFLWWGWSDGGGLSHGITFSGNDTVITASFTRQFFLTMSADTGGTVSPPSAWYDSAAVVEISAAASAGYSFVSWTGTGTGSYSGAADTSSVTMNGPVTQYAEFTLSAVPVTVTTDPPGLAVTVDGVSTTAPGFFNWIPGSSHTISTDSVQLQSGGGRFLWSAWSDGGGLSHGVTFSGNDTVISASFNRQFYLTMSAGTGGTVSPPSAWYDSTAVVEISAAASAGYGFVSWAGTGAGSYSGAADTSTVTMNGPVTEYAEFAQSTVPVTVTTDPPGLLIRVDGIAYTAPRSFNWISGSSHTISTDSLQAGDSTEARHRWTGWNDGGARTHGVAASAPASFTAVFGPQYMLTTLADTGGTAAPPGGWYDSAQVVNISSAVLPGYVFNGWTGTGPGSYTGPANPIQVVMNGPIVETAHFSPQMVSVTVETAVPGLTVTVDGVTAAGTQSFSWIAGTSHSIGTDSLQDDGVPGTLYRWTGWNDAGARVHTVSTFSDTTFRAFFATLYLLTTGTDSGGSVSPATAWYTSGRLVVLTASPDSGFEFAGWSGTGNGSYTGTDNPAVVTISGPISQTAHFTPVPVLPPAVTTLAAGSVSSQSAVLNGTVDPNGEPTTVWFEWGTDSLLSVYDTTTSQSAGSGDSVAAFGEVLTSLAARTTYYFRVAASNSAGTSTGDIVAFTTDTQAVAGPEFALTRSSLDFGGVMIGDQKTDSLMILNLGDAPLSVSSIAVTSGDYSVSMSSTNVPPGGSRLLYVTYSPTGTAGGDAWLTMTHNDPQSPDSVLLSGYGYTPGIPVLSASSLTFVYPDGPALQTREVYIRNAGDVTLQVSTLKSTNGQYSAEMLLTQIAPGDSQPVSVTCNPDTGQAPDGYIVILYDGTASPDTVSVSYDIVLGVGQGGGLPEAPALRQNYPNPFNPSTTIGFTLSTGGRVLLVVYDVLGRQVDVVVDEVLGPGVYTRRWDAGERPGGVYYYRIQAGDVTLTRSMVLTK